MRCIVGGVYEQNIRVDNWTGEFVSNVKTVFTKNEVISPFCEVTDSIDFGDV